MEILWEHTVSAEFQINRPKLRRNCALSLFINLFILYSQLTKFKKMKQRKNPLQYIKNVAIPKDILIYVNYILKIMFN